MWARRKCVPEENVPLVLCSSAKWVCRRGADWLSGWVVLLSGNGWFNLCLLTAYILVKVVILWHKNQTNSLKILWLRFRFLFLNLINVFCWLSTINNCFQEPMAASRSKNVRNSYIESHSVTQDNFDYRILRNCSQ